MSKFMLTIDSFNLARQIANLINVGGQLKVVMTAKSVLCDSTRYLIELDREVVVGVIGLKAHNNVVTEIKHLCVRPNYRGQGIGKRLLKRAIETGLSNTKFVYGLVRSDNSINIRNNLTLGMKPIGKKSVNNHTLILFAKSRHV